MYIYGYLVEFCIARKDYVTSNPHKVTISFNFALLSTYMAILDLAV
jgi:hypothetical protein